MRKPSLVVTGAVIALLGVVFTLQGIGVITGSFMSNTTFWAVAGPVIAIVGVAVAWRGARERTL